MSAAEAVAYDQRPARASGRGRELLLMAALFAVLAFIPTRLDLELQFDATITVIYALSILSLVLLTGYVGQISLCQSTFMGISAFGTGMLVNTFHFNYFLAIPFGVLMSFLVGLVIAIPALRIRGILLAVVTLGVALVFDKYFFIDNQFAWFTGGSFGWHVNGSRLGSVKVDALHVIPAYWILLALLFGITLLMLNINRSGSGRRFRAIRDSELAAATMGVDLTRYKLLAFGLSAAIAVLMGIRYVPSAAVGGFFLGFMPVLLTRLSHVFHREIRYDWFQVALGILLIVQLITLPDGVWGDVRKNWTHLKDQIAERRRQRAEVGLA